MFAFPLSSIAIASWTDSGLRLTKLSTAMVERTSVLLTVCQFGNGAVVERTSVLLAGVERRVVLLTICHSLVMVQW